MTMKTYQSIKHWNGDDQPREKLAAKGKEILSDAELLAILLGTGTSRKSAVDLARDVLQLANNDLNQLAKLSISDFSKIDGIGPAKAITIIAAIELASRRKMATVIRKQYIKSSEDAYNYFGPMLQDKNYEEFWILMLSRNNQIIKPYRVSDGGVSGTVADPKRIFKTALENNAVSLIICHNHPSGNLNPSAADVAITNKLVDAGKHLDIGVLDHLIVSNQGYYSFADSNKI